MRLGQEAGYTLIELMMVAAILGILLALVEAASGQAIRRSREASTKANLGILRAAIGVYGGFHDGNYPIDQLQCLVAEGFVNRIPAAQFPTYHAPSNLVALVSQGAINDGHVGYYYNDCNAPCPVCTPDLVAQWGTLVLSCRHVDLKGIVWSTW